AISSANNTLGGGSLHLYGRQSREDARVKKSVDPETEAKADLKKGSGRARKSKKDAYLGRLAKLLVTATKSEVVAARALEDETRYLKLYSDGYELAISVADVRLVQGSLDEALERRKSLRGRYNRFN